MSLNWKKESGGALHIKETGSPLAKLFGVPFAAAGAYFLYHFVMGFVDAIRFGGLLAFLPGSFLLLLMIALFGLPGIVLLLGKRRVVVDPATRRVRVIRDYGVYRKTEHYPSNDYQAVQALHELRKVESRKDTRTTTKHYETYPVRLASVKGKSVEIASADNAEQALNLAMEVGGLLGLPVADLTAEWDSASEAPEPEPK